MTCNQLPRRHDHFRDRRQRRREKRNEETSPFPGEGVVPGGGKGPGRVNRAGHGVGVEDDRSDRDLVDFVQSDNDVSRGERDAERRLRGLLR